MPIQQLTVNSVQPTIQNLEQLIQHIPETESDILTLQPRLQSALSLLINQKKSERYTQRFALIKAPESKLFFSLLTEKIQSTLQPNQTCFAYHFNDNKITLNQTHNKQDNFSATSNCLYSIWLESETLLGGVRQPDDNNITLFPGLVHKANGGILILSLRALLTQPLLWHRLKHMVTEKRYDWFSSDESNPLPISIPPIPLDLRVILVGDRISLADLQEYDPEFYELALYGEFESTLSIQTDKQISLWCQYIRFLAAKNDLPHVENTAFAELIKAGVRNTEDQSLLPLSPDWLTALLAQAAQYCQKNVIDADSIKTALSQKFWRESYLIDRFKAEFANNQVMINTQGQIVGQINGLSVIEYPGYPRTIGEPTRLSCLIHFGDGDLVDIDRKTELAGNIHAKGMMIMQSFIAAEFSITHQLPFSASLVFEQSYSEIDGDSASLAGLCAMISALSAQPIDQQLAVTGSIDQFGRVQPIGGVNEKIEGFFDICQQQGLTGQQGVIIPSANQNHLSLNDNVIQAIANQQFSIWTVDNIAEALYLLTGIPYKDDSPINLYKLIQTRISSAMMQDKQTSWFRKWLK